MNNRSVSSEFTAKVIKVWKLPPEAVARTIEMEDTVNGRNVLTLAIAFTIFLSIIDKDFPGQESSGIDNYFLVGLRYANKQNVVEQFFPSFLELTDYLGR